MVGLTHHAVPLPLLEQVTIRRGQRGPLLAALHAAGYTEAVVLSTCSRTEIYAVPESEAPQELLALLAEHTECSLAELRLFAEDRAGLEAVEHLFRVAGGLDSRVIGEVEILGQVRTAFREAHAAGMAGSSLCRLFPAAMLTGRRVRDETTLGVQGRSLASRNEAHAARLAGPGQVCPLPALVSGLEKADLVICATSAAQHVVTLAHVRQAMASRHSRPLTVVDLSVPRNVEGAVASVAGVRLIDLEGMNDDWASDPALAAAVEGGTAIVESAARRYADGMAAANAGPFIAALRQHVEQTCLRELAKMANSQTLRQLDLERAAHAVAGKLLHRPTITARAAAASGDAGALLALGDIFGIRLPGPALGR